ncbi:hypothetical protein RR46_14108 [Papilio xuthus]|uniref:Uncharacterized protein n=1 Tax=Papilio xuthus TaxID=66420 RepID=A0A194PHU3_PAPXU|nr:hypothetical protein RR46_14108 [Papilio xuthus]
MSDKLNREFYASGAAAFNYNNVAILLRAKGWSCLLDCRIKMGSKFGGCLKRENVLFLHILQ